MILTRSRPSWYLPGIMIIWGAICAVMSVVKNYQGMLALRFFLGCIEAGFFPGVLYVMTCWYKKAEIGKYSHRCRREEPSAAAERSKQDPPNPAHVIFGTNVKLQSRKAVLDLLHRLRLLGRHERPPGWCNHWKYGRCPGYAWMEMALPDRRRLHHRIRYRPQVHLARLPRDHEAVLIGGTSTCRGPNDPRP